MKLVYVKKCFYYLSCCQDGKITRVNERIQIIYLDHCILRWRCIQEIKTGKTRLGNANDFSMYKD